MAPKHNLPPSILIALGLAVGGPGCIGPCLDVAVETDTDDTDTDTDTDIGPCLDVPPDTDTDTDTGTGPCLDIAQAAEEPVAPMLDTKPKTVPATRDQAVNQVLKRKVLPDDVAKILEQRRKVDAKPAVDAKKKD